MRRKSLFRYTKSKSLLLGVISIAATFTSAHLSMKLAGEETQTCSSSIAPKLWWSPVYSQTFDEGLVFASVLKAQRHLLLGESDVNPTIKVFGWRVTPACIRAKREVCHCIDQILIWLFD